MAKDPLCPLGFHPQVRWPTRCKRCFREYKEHAKKEEPERLDVRTQSTANLLRTSSSEWESRSRLTPSPSLPPARSPAPSPIPSPTPSPVPPPPTRTTEIEESRSRSGSVSSTTSSTSIVTVDENKDFSTPYSSISSEALNRLNRYRGEEKRPHTPATSDSLTADAPSRRRRTTDLSGGGDSRSSSDSDSSRPNSRVSDRGGRSTPSSFPSAETVTVRLRKTNSFPEQDVRETRDSSSSPTPPKTPSPTESPVLPRRGRLPVTKDSESSGVDSGSSHSSPYATTGSSSLVKSSSEDVTAATSTVKQKKPRKKRLLIQGVKEVTQEHDTDPDSAEGDSSADVAFIIQVKSTRKKKKDGDDDDILSMTTTTDTTETTLVDVTENNSAADGGFNSWEFEEVKKEVDRLREKCDRLEKEKAEILSRRVANLEAPKAQSSEYLRLQQRVNQLTTINEDLKDEQKHLEIKVRELEVELAARPSTEIMQRQISELRSKITSTEATIDQMHEEKREVVMKMRDLEEEMEEMKDSYREQQSEEFAATKKELDYEQKNNRLLQFKLRKVEKRCDHLDAEKKELELRLESSNSAGKVAKLEEELAKSKAEIEKLLKETKKDKSGKDNNTLTVPGGGALKKKSPVLTKAPSGEKVDPPLPPDFDPEQMLRDLQSTLERESDLREQLKFAEEEAQSLRQKISRIEEENESLLIQIKKMSSKSRTDLNKGKVETGSFRDPVGNQNGEKLDATDLKLQLEINDEQSKVLQRKVVELEDANSKLEKRLQQADEKVITLESATPVTKSKNVDEVSLLRRKLIEKERELERSQAELMTATKNKGKITRAKSLEIEESTKRLDTETKAELKKVTAELAKLKEEADEEKQRLENDLTKAKKDLENQQSRTSQINDSNKALVGQIEKFKKEMNGMKEQYESIQDDFVIKNSQLTSQKEDFENNYNKVKKEFDTIDKELKALRETFNDRQDTWIKEKLAMQEKMKEVEQNSKKLLSIPGDKDSTKLKNLLKERSLDSDIRSRELETYKDQILQMQRDNDALRRQLEDFDKVTQVQMRSLAHQETPKSDKELKELKEKLSVEEKLHKTDVAQLKMRKDQELALKSEEISSIQSQLSRAKRERDTFRQMVDSAQRAIAELKSRDTTSSLQRDSSLTGLEEAATGARAAVMTLQDRVTSLEDDLAEARRDTSRAKTEIVTERSTWELKLGELQQKINELEEEKLLGGAGRVRGSSALGRTRIELAWQKERDEQQRRLKEATTLARDLKTTLLEIERERDRERVEARRRQEQMKATMEEEQEEMKRKVGESQCDLLELRDAHAKLRTANEKLRKDRERLESQREAQIKKELESRKVYLEREKILDQLMNKVSSVANPTASNANLSQSKMSPTEIMHYLQNIKALTEADDINNPKEKRRGAFKRASSLGDAEGAEIPKSRESLVSMPATGYGMKEHYGAAGRTPYLGSVSSSTLTLPSRGRAPGMQIGGRGIINIGEFAAHSSAGFQARGSLIRKAVSLEQTVAMPDEQKIWKGGSEAGSASSITSQDGQYSRGSSVDRMSNISTKSDKPKSLAGKLKKFVKSKSIEETPTAERLVKAGIQAGGVASNAGSDLSLNSADFDQEREREKEPKNLKDKVKGMFKRSTRSPSVERNISTPIPASSVSQLYPPQRPSRESTPKRDVTPSPAGQSTQRPLMPMSSQRPLMPSSGMR